jgi:hypothetical protein
MKGGKTVDLLQFDGVGAMVRLYPEDCAKLAQVCTLGEETLIKPEEEPLAEAARNYAALFRACTLAGLTPRFLVGDAQEMMGEDLAGLGLGDLLRPRPGGGETASQ